eukprot:g10324.t1
MLLPCVRSSAFARQAGVRAHLPSRGFTAAARPRGSDLPLFYNDVYRVELPEGHRFPMEKYRLVREGLQGALKNASFSVSPVATMEDLCTTHDRRYVQRYFDGHFTDRENRTVGFPWSEASVRRSLSSVGGTVGAMHAVCAGGELRDRLAGAAGPPPPLMSGHIAGGTHHAFFSRGEGFCVFSDIAVAANVALRDYPETVRQILIVDCDVHQGNGNAVLFRSKPAVFTFSVHCKANYFSEKEQSDLDVEVDEGVGDEEYLRLLEERIPTLVDQVRPDLIFYQGGVDPLEHDRLGRLNLTREGLRRRNRLVYATALERGIPTVITMGGGYPTDLNPGSESFGHIVRSHRDVYEDAADSVQASPSSWIRGGGGSADGGGGTRSTDWADAPGAPAAGEVASRW